MPTDALENVYLVVRTLKRNDLSQLSIVVGAFVDPAKAYQLADEQQARQALHGAARVFGAEIEHQVVPLKVAT